MQVQIDSVFRQQQSKEEEIGHTIPHCSAYSCVVVEITFSASISGKVKVIPVGQAEFCLSCANELLLCH
jgi:predicted Zn-dependent protease